MLHSSTSLVFLCHSCDTVSENKVLTHPSSVDSQSTSAATEDHVSMGGFAARKALSVVEHVETGKAKAMWWFSMSLPFLCLTLPPPYIDFFLFVTCSPCGGLWAFLFYGQDFLNKKTCLEYKNGSSRPTAASQPCKKFWHETSHLPSCSKLLTGDKSSQVLW